MKLFKIYIYTTLCIATLLAGCTDRFESLNDSENGFTDEELTQDFNHVKSLFEPMLNNVYTYSPAWVTQLQQNLIGDVYSGYMMPPTPFAGNINNMNYALVDGWNGFPWSTAYKQIMTNALRVEQRSKENTPQFYAWSLIVKVEAMHRVSDIYGPIVYSSFGTEDSTIPYDSQQEAYNQFFQDLETAIGILTPLAQAGSPSSFTGTDFTVYDGDYSGWIKFANSLRLRLAMRIVNVDPSKAKVEAEKSYTHPIGVITSNSESAVVASPKFTHPLVTINGGWGDIRMGAPMESILKGYDDPRINNYFYPSAIVPGEFKGIRNGIDILSKAHYAVFSPIGPVIESNKVQWMSAAEVYFLRAEGALRGWNMGGSSQSLYEEGISTSFEQYGSGGIAEYIADATSTAIAYVDPVSAVNNVDLGDSHLSTATIAWDNGASNEVLLEKIITQKWIAMFPDGQEAWSEFRRTGYPKLFPVVLNNSNGKISTEDFIRRINFPTSEYNANPNGVQTGVSHLSGPDTGGTRLWWDVAGSNF